jgi:hypothetical protein
MVREIWNISAKVDVTPSEGQAKTTSGVDKNRDDEAD